MENKSTTMKSDNRFDKSVPEKDKLVTMTKEELEDLVNDITKEFREELEKTSNRTEALQIALEKDSAIAKVNAKGQYADRDLSITQLGPLGPIDHQKAAIVNAGVDDQLKDKAYRFVSTNPELRALRRSQGYEPILDSRGNEVRYMDGTLMAMSKAKHQELVRKPVETRKAIHRAAIKQEFENKAIRAGVVPTGEGIVLDKGE